MSRTRCVGETGEGVRRGEARVMGRVVLGRRPGRAGTRPAGKEGRSPVPARPRFRRGARATGRHQRNRTSTRRGRVPPRCGVNAPDRSAFHRSRCDRGDAHDCDRAHDCDHDQGNELRHARASRSDNEPRSRDGWAARSDRSSTASTATNRLFGGTGAALCSSWTSSLEARRHASQYSSDLSTPPRPAAGVRIIIP